MTDTQPVTTTRARSADPSLKQITASIPADELATLDAAARKAHVSRSLALREGAKLWVKAQARG